MSNGVDFRLTGGLIDALVNELSESSCRDLCQALLRERLEAVGTPVAEGLSGPEERVQIILNAVRGPLGDRWIVEEPYSRLIADEVVVAWRRPWSEGDAVLAPAARESEWWRGSNPAVSITKCRPFSSGR